MKFFVERLSTAAQTWGAIVHLGAGACTELAAYRRMRPTQLLLVEAHPRLADELGRKLLASRGEKAVQAAVTAQTGPASLQVLNNLSESSVLAPCDLMAYLPNLRLAETIEVPAVSLQSLLADLQPDAELANLLVLEIGGLELEVLAATDELQLHKFSHVLVRGADAALYAGGAVGSALKDRLCQAGFLLDDSQPEHLAPFMNWLFLRDEQVVRQRRYVHALEQTAAENKRLSAALELAQRTHEEQLQALQAEHRDALQDVVQQLVDNLNSALRQNMQQDEVLQELQHHIEQLEGEGRAAADKLQELAQNMNDVLREKVALEERLKETAQELAGLGPAKEQLAQLELDRSTQAELERQREVYLTQLQLARDNQERQLGDLQAELASRALLLEAASAAASERDDLLAAKELQGRIAADARLQVERLEADNAVLKRTSEELAQQLSTARDALADAKDGRDAARQRIAELEYLLGDQSEHQQLLDVEVVRAQAQIALLRDVLLREPGL